MKTAEATRLYNEAEREIEENATFTSISEIMKRGTLVGELLEKLHGEETADEILELVFENEIG